MPNEHKVIPIQQRIVIIKWGDAWETPSQLLARGECPPIVGIRIYCEVDSLSPRKLGAASQRKEGADKSRVWPAFNLPSCENLNQDLKGSIGEMVLQSQYAKHVFRF